MMTPLVKKLLRELELAKVTREKLQELRASKTLNKLNKN